MKKILFAVFTIVASLLFAACDDEDYTVVPPTFKGFLYSPSPLHPGDTVAISAVFASKGNYVGKPRCKWSLTLDTLDHNTNTYMTATLHKSTNGSIGDEKLTAKFPIPKTAKKGQKANCNLTIQFDNYVDANNIGFYVESKTEDGYLGKFGRSTVKALLASDCSGSVTISIE